jgi:hypothetical protein
MMGLGRFRRSRYGTALATWIASTAQGFQPVSAWTTDSYDSVMTSLTSYIAVIGSLALLIAVIVLLMKSMSKKKVKTMIIDSNHDYKKMAFLSILMFGCALGCNNNFVLRGHNQICSTYQGPTNCSIETELQMSLGSLGSCSQLSSTDPENPFSLTISLAGSFYLLNTEIMYYSQLARCYYSCAGSCDYSWNDNGLSQCDLFNSYGETCTGVNYDATGFPLSTNNQFTRCQCDYFENQDCPGSLGDVTKNFGYTTLKANGTSFPVFDVKSYSQAYLIKVDIIATNPVSFYCMVTPFSSYCQQPGISMSFVATESLVNPVNNIYLFSTSPLEHYYSSYAQPKGQANTCSLGNIQLNTGGTITNTGTSTAIVYENYCSLSFTSSYGSCTSSGCSPQITDYGTLLPVVLPGMGTLSYINDTSSGFSSYVLNLGSIANSLTFDVIINKNLTFSLSDSTVCPQTSNPTGIVGCYSCNSLASFQITAYSSCEFGTAYLKCNYEIVNPSIFLNNSAAIYTFQFYTDNSNPSITCTLQGTTTSTFSTNALSPLSLGVVDLQANGNGTAYVLPPSSSSSKEDKNLSIISLSIISLVLFCMFICFLGLAAYCCFKLVIKF